MAETLTTELEAVNSMLEAIMEAGHKRAQPIVMPRNAFPIVSSCSSTMSIRSASLFCSS